MEASVGQGLRQKFSTQRFGGHKKRNSVQQQHVSSQCTFWAQNKKGEGRIVSQKNPSTIWRDHCTSLSRKNRADLVERYGPVVVCDLAAFTRVAGGTGPDISWDVKKCDRQNIPSQKSRHQSNRLLRRERERRVRDSVREQRQVARLLEVAVSPSCGGTQLRTSATPRTLCEISVVTEDTSSGLRKKTESEHKPQRHWTSISTVSTTEKKIDEGCKIDRTPEDGVLLIVPVVIKGKICKALIDSGATRCFVSPSCMTVAGLQGKRSDTFLELGNGQRVLSRGYVPEVPVTLSGHTSTVDMTVTSLLHDVDVVLGMTWLKSVRPIIDWFSGEVYIPNSVSTSLIHGEWLQAAVKAGTVIVLSSSEKLKEL